MIPYSLLAPLLGQALTRSRSTGRAHHVVARSGMFSSGFRVVDKIADGDAIIVHNVGGPGLSGHALSGAASVSLGDQLASLRVLRAVTGHPNGTPFSAEDIAAGLWLLACRLSTLDREERERAAGPIGVLS